MCIRDRCSAARSAASVTGCMVPISLFAHITETTAVPGVIADFGVVGDLFRVAPQLQDEVAKRKS